MDRKRQEPETGGSGMEEVGKRSDISRIVLSLLRGAWESWQEEQRPNRRTEDGYLGPKRRRGWNQKS